MTHARTCEYLSDSTIRNEIAKLVKQEEKFFGLEEIDIPKINPAKIFD